MSRKASLRILLMFILLLAADSLIVSFATEADEDPHKQIQGPFNTPMDVTNKCLECHKDSAQQVMKTSHWTWELEQDIPGKGKVKLGKKGAINNFCVSIAANWPRCTSCHIGYGWKDETFDFADVSRVDCLICHDTTGEYGKSPAGAGMPEGFEDESARKPDTKPVDLVKVAQHVGKSTRRNCLVCHAAGGGGINVKHGDIDLNLTEPTNDYDIHMGIDGLNFSCQQCHVTKEHQIKGNAMSVSPGGDTRVACTDCHGENAHRKVKAGVGYDVEGATKKLERLNQHSKRIGCETCHIPAFAQFTETKMHWDWSATEFGGGEQEMDKRPGAIQRLAFNPQKGSFVYEENALPVYRWYNYKAGRYVLGEKIDATRPVQLAYPLGSREDKDAKIYPFKLHTGTQIYDVANEYLITPKVFGFEGDPDAYWVSGDWDKAAAAGMKASGLEYSGDYDFVPTEMYWRITHTVAPAKDALTCPECHRNNGRMDWQALGYEGDPLDQ